MAEGNGTAVARRVDPIKELVERHQDTWQKLLPPGLRNNLGRFMVLVTKAIKAVPKLWDSDKTTLLTAIAEAAELGLEPNGVLGHGWLVPYKGQVKFIPGFKGFIQLAHRCGGIKMWAEVVRDGDHFIYQLGDSPKLEHRPNPDADESDSAIRYVYAVAKFPDGTTQFCVMSRRQVDGIMAKSQSASSDRSPWKTHYSEMARKCPIRRLAKFLPLQNEEWAKLIETDNRDYEDRIIDAEEVPHVRRRRSLELNRKVEEQAPEPPAVNPPAAEDPFQGAPTREPGQEG